MNHESNISNTSRSTVNQPKKKSAVAQMRDLSQSLEREQSMNQPTAKTIPKIPSGFRGRKRLIDNVFEEIFDPRELAQPLVGKSTVTTSTVPTPRAPIITTQLFKKPRLESQDLQKSSRIDKIPQCSDISLHKESSSQQVHSHTQDCNRLVLEEACDKKEPIVSSLYDPLPESKLTSSTSFFTAGPVWWVHAWVYVAKIPLHSFTVLCV